MKMRTGLPQVTTALEHNVTDKDRRDAAGYISDLLLEMRVLARRTGLKHLTYLIELAIYEAFELANGAPPKPQDFQHVKPSSSP